MANLQKKIKGTENVLAAFTLDNGMAIGSKKSGGYYVDAIVILKGNKDGTLALYINEDKLEELKGNVVFKKFADEIV